MYAMVVTYVGAGMCIVLCQWWSAVATAPKAVMGGAMTCHCSAAVVRAGMSSSMCGWHFEGRGWCGMPGQSEGARGDNVQLYVLALAHPLPFLTNCHRGGIRKGFGAILLDGWGS